MPPLTRLRLLWTGSIRRRLILGLCATITVGMMGFVYQTVERQRQLLETQDYERSLALTRALAANSTSWVLANDLVGLAEVVGSTRSYPELHYAMVMSRQGRVLAHTNPSLIGMYLSDDASVRGLGGTPVEQTISRTRSSIDVAVPITSGGVPIGWARTGLGQESVTANLRDIQNQGILFATLVIAVTLTITAAVGSGLTRGLDHLVTATRRIAAGEAGTRSGMKRDDELGALGTAFDRMAEALETASLELRSRQDELRHILARLPVGILIRAPNGTVYYANDNARAILGITSEDAFCPYWRFIREDGSYLRPCETPSIMALRSGRPLHGQILRLLPYNSDSSSEPRWLYISAYPERNADGEVSQLIVSFLDLTARRQAEEELRRYKDQLEVIVEQRTSELLVARDAAEAANKTKSVFLANMSHELRTPLNAILGFSSLMRCAPDVIPDHREKLDIINRSGEHLLTLINDVLEMAKIEAGRLQLDHQPFDLGDMVRDVTDMMRLKAEEKGLRLMLDQSSTFPRYIKGDEVRLRQVLVNLVGNAVKFTTDGGVVIRLGTRRNARQHLIIEVEDSGPGIAPEDKARLFQPFVQLAKSDMQRGTGLGLVISRQFVELMGGTICTESTLGKGSIFRIDLPVELAAEADSARPRSKAENGVVRGLAPGQPAYRILITEDQPENQLLLMKLMAELGLETRLAENGERCVQIFQEWHPHLIWMDRRMPIMDGIEATRRIRALPDGQEVKIIAVTASVFGEQRQELCDAGMNDFVRKPYRFHEIYDCLARHLGVKYVHATVVHTTEEEPPPTLTPEMLTALPEPLRYRLAEALTILDSDSILAVIREVNERDKDLAEVLTHLVEEYDYPAILNALSTTTHA